MLVHSVNRVPRPAGSSFHRISNPPHVYSSRLGASARVTVVSDTFGVGAPTVVSFTVVPATLRFRSASNGAHSRSCVGSVSACQTFSGEWRSSLIRTSVHFSPCFSNCALAAPGAYCSRAVTVFSLSFFSFVPGDECDRDGARAHPRERTRSAETAQARRPLPEAVRASADRDAAVRLRLLRQSRRRAARAGALTPSAAASEAPARSPRPLFLSY